MREQEEHFGEFTFDRLVDGELSADERHDFLLSLDERENGWRNCALAFLEAQAWKRELTLLAHQETTEDATQGAGRSAVRQKWRAAGWLALAASLLVAFTLGLVVKENHSASGPLAMIPGSQPSVDQIETDAAQPGLQVFDAPTDQLASNDDMLELWVHDEQGRRRSLHVPLVEAAELDRRWGLQFHSGIPEHVRRRLEDNGYSVRSRRRYAPVWVERGQPMLLPVEDTRIMPVSRPVY